MTRVHTAEGRRRSQDSILQKLWGTTEDLRGQHTAKTAVRNHWGPHGAAHCISCEEPLRTSQDSRTLQKRQWGTTEDLRKQHIAEAVRNHWGPHRAAHWGSCEEPPRTSEDSRTLQKKLWGTTEDLGKQHIAETVRNHRWPPRAAHCRSCEEPPRTSEGSTEDLRKRQFSFYLLSVSPFSVRWELFSSIRISC